MFVDSQKTRVTMPAPVLRALRKQPLDMGLVVEAAESILLPLLKNPNYWGGFIRDEGPQPLHAAYCRLDDGNPRIGRVIGTYIFLQYHPVPEGKTSGMTELPYHRHSWASGMRDVKGWYDQWTGHSDQPYSDVPPPRIVNTRHMPGSINVMNLPGDYHQLILPPEPVYTLLVAHRPIDWPVPSEDFISRPLGRDNILGMTEKFHGFYLAQTEIMSQIDKLFRRHEPAYSHERPLAAAYK